MERKMFYCSGKDGGRERQDLEEDCETRTKGNGNLSANLVKKLKDINEIRADSHHLPELAQW